MTTHPTIGPTDEFPNRPDSLDFDILSAAVVAMDAEAEEGAGDDQTIPRMVGRFIDSDALTYMAIQRAVRALNIVNEEGVRVHSEQLYMMSGLYIDAFTAGCMFQKTKGNQKD